MTDTPLGSVETDDTVSTLPPATSARTVGLGAIWNMAAYLLPQILTLALSVIIARKLGPDLQGVQSYLSFIAMTVGTIFGLGLPSAIEQAISRYLGEGRPALVRAFGFWAVRSTVIPAVLSFVTVLIVGRFAYPAYAMAWLAAAIASAMVTTHAVASQGLNGLHEFRIPSGIGVATQLIVSTVSALALLFLGIGVTELLAINAVGTVVSAVLTMRAFMRHLPREQRQSHTALSSELSTAKRAALSFAGVSGIVVLLETIVAKRSEFVFLGWLHHDRPREMAFYSVAFACATAVAAIPQALVSVAMPVVSRMIASGDHARMRAGYHQAQKLLLIVSAPAAGGVLGCGSALIFVAYGHDYAESAKLVLIACVAPIVAGPLGGLAGASLLGSGNPKAAVRAQVIAAVVTVLADIALIWPFAALGATIAASLGLIAGTWSLQSQARKELSFAPIGLDAWWNALVSAVATAVPGLVLLAVGAPDLVTLFGGALLGVVACLLVWTIIKPLSPGHLQLIGSIVSKLPPAGQRALDRVVHYEGTRRR